MSQGSLTRIQLEGFRSIRSAELKDIGSVTVLIGPNGSGKSNLLSFLKMVPLMSTGSLRDFVGRAGGASSLLHYHSNTTHEITFRLEFEQERGANAYDVCLGFAANDTLIFLDERVEFRPEATQNWQSYSLDAGHKESRLQHESMPTASNTKKTMSLTSHAVRRCLSGMSFFHFHDTSMTSRLRTHSKAVDSRYLRSDGSNLAAYLLSLQQGETRASQVSWRKINHLVRKIAPCIKNLQPTSTNGTSVRLDWVDDRDEVFGCHDLSDGTLRAIALITALAQPSNNLPTFISIDEPELGLHPAALSLFASLVRSVSQRCQVMLATQSPALLDHFAVDEIVVTERIAGETQFKRLDQESLKEWLDEYSLSQLYDKNLLGGRP